MAEAYAKRLKALVDSATDKDAVKNSIGTKLYENGSMGLDNPNAPTSSKDAEIDAIIGEFEGDAEMSADVENAMKKMGGKKRRTRKLKRKTRKTRKYSRRR